MSGHHAADDGYFPRESMLATVHRERLVGLLCGQRALCIGALMPLNFVGTMNHTAWRDRPFQRLCHTGERFETVMLGPRAEADRVLEMVARMHDRVSGELSVDAGPAAPAGTPYRAMDPDLMLWTVAVIADSARCIYELLIRRLDDAEREALWQDYVRFGALFGLSPTDCPDSYPAFRAWWEQRLASEQMHLTPEARYIGHATLFRIPLPTLSAPAGALHNALQLGALPEVVRRHYGLAYGPVERAAYLAALAAMRTGRAFLPSFLARGSALAHYRRVARTEADRITHGRPTPRLSDLDSLPARPQAVSPQPGVPVARASQHAPTA